MNKRLLIILHTIILFALSMPVFAAVGDVAGYIYSTDIRAYINGVEVQSYNIGGKTAVVIEEIMNNTKYVYDDFTRTLKFSSLRPEILIESKKQANTISGDIIGKIYDTDIKTSIYDTIIPTYNIGGKTAVALEDLGSNGEFSDIGGKYFWNEAERKISLEFLYENSSIISEDKTIHIFANDTMTEATATFNEVLHCGGGREHFSFPEYVTDDADIKAVMPIKSGGTTIGYYFRRPSEMYKFTAFTHYYPEKIKEAEKEYIPLQSKTREDIISHFVTVHSFGDPRERFDTDEYSFVYTSVAGTSWTAYNLLQAYNDGTYMNYKDIIHRQNCSPQNLIIDKENEKVTFRLVDRYSDEWFTNYEIDLKTGKIRAYDNLITDIGIGTAEGQPSESEQTETRNGQYEFKLVSGEDEKTVNGFFAHEYYYADMLPLKETFDFLNIKYSFENNILTIDTSEAKPFIYEKTGNTAEVIGKGRIDYLCVDKVLLNGKEAQITFPYISGHFDNTHYGRSKAKPYVCNGKVYVNGSFISWLYE